jgi:hypothetical protein
MASSSNIRSKGQYIAVTRVIQEVRSRMTLVVFAILDMQNATLAANGMKDFIATLGGLSPFHIKNQFARLKEHVHPEATTFSEVREGSPHS